MIDVELFGNVKNFPNQGAPARIGLIGAADGGHLFLDEIGDVLLAHQVHLLRVMDTGTYQRLGEPEERSSDVLFLAATNRPEDALKHDFLARFVLRVTVPPLAARKSDIPFLIRDYLVRQASRREEVERFLGPGNPRPCLIEPQLVAALLRHDSRKNTRDRHRLLEVAIESSSGSFLAFTPEVAAALEAMAQRAAKAGAAEQGAAAPTAPEQGVVAAGNEHVAAAAADAQVAEEAADNELPASNPTWADGAAESRAPTKDAPADEPHGNARENGIGRDELVAALETPLYY